MSGLPSGVGTAFLYPTQVGGSAGYESILQAAPPDTNAPIIFEPEPALSGGNLVVWLLVSGAQPNWGGCQVWASVDGGTSYGQLGVALQGAVQGVLTAVFPAGSDPDTTNVLSVDVSMSGNQINSGSHVDADLGITMAYVDGELVGFSNVVLTSTNMYNLDTYLRRGMFETVNSSHASGTQFGVMGGNVFSHTYPTNLVGVTAYFKFPSFNTVGGQLQDISTVTAYPYTLLGTGLARGMWATPMSVGGHLTDLVLDPWDGNYEIFDVQVPWAINFPANLVSSPIPGCSVAPAANVTLTLQMLDAAGAATTVGTVSIAAGALTGAFSCSAFTVAEGHRLRLFAPSSVDSTIAGLYGTIVGSRN